MLRKALLAAVLVTLGTSNAWAKDSLKFSHNPKPGQQSDLASYRGCRVGFDEPRTPRSDIEIFYNEFLKKECAGNLWWMSVYQLPDATYLFMNWPAGLEVDDPDYNQTWHNYARTLATSFGRTWCFAFGQPSTGVKILARVCEDPAPIDH
jgi:hypothetical protein